MLHCTIPSPHAPLQQRNAAMNNERHYLHTLFEPESIAVIGASETPKQ